jgi:hypothetical protein
MARIADGARQPGVQPPAGWTHRCGERSPRARSTAPIQPHKLPGHFHTGTPAEKASTDEPGWRAAYIDVAVSKREAPNKLRCREILIAPSEDTRTPPAHGLGSMSAFAGQGPIWRDRDSTSAASPDSACRCPHSYRCPLVRAALGIKRHFPPEDPQEWRAIRGI